MGVPSVVQSIWSTLCCFTLELAVFVVVDTFTKHQLRNASTEEEKTRIWAIEGGLLTVITLLLLLWSHVPYTLLLLTGSILVFILFPHHWLHMARQSLQEGTDRVQHVLRGFTQTTGAPSTRRTSISSSISNGEDMSIMSSLYAPTRRTKSSLSNTRLLHPTKSLPSANVRQSDSDSLIQNDKMLIRKQKKFHAVTPVGLSPARTPSSGLGVLPRTNRILSSDTGLNIATNFRNPVTYSPSKYGLRARPSPAKKTVLDLQLPPGLQNGGQNICFMNSILQCLAHNPVLVQGLQVAVEQPKVSQPGGTLLLTFVELAADCQRHRDKEGLVIDPTAFRSVVAERKPELIVRPEWSHIQPQQDAAEFLTWLLDALSAEVRQERTSFPLTPPYSPIGSPKERVGIRTSSPRADESLHLKYGKLTTRKLYDLEDECVTLINHANSLKPETYAEPLKTLSEVAWYKHCHQNNTVVDTSFTGQLVEARHCLLCGKLSLSMEVFSVLPVHIPEQNSMAMDLEACIVNLANVENLQKESGFRCTCARAGDSEQDLQTTAQRRCLLRYHPECLIIQLQRFNYATKTQVPVNIPLHNLNLNSLHVDNLLPDPDLGPPDDCVYSLYAVCMHLGTTRDCGHYVAYALLDDGLWYKFDDEVVRVVNSMQSELRSAIVKRNAYILFYRKSNKR
ncbi:ubiquitin carboxyl-terminal hydrolase 2-like [Branchiostoma lanceolatum]|uniref:ubiquitin carboxyl-terminal hydrolase 2-like n=1 Tax=Branchiostoma lanceolatum TaxID=7740 RepID=UPI0034525DA1